ncbi:membrane protein mmpL3 [Mycobacteroides abscessus subsp. abscessus]|nr:membrane protein mmpL3 [Mycobacteroides abscessus subsp. abscessus]
MFAWWGRMVYRYRFIVVAAFVTVCLGSGLFGITLGDHVTQSGFFADNSESVKASVMADDALGRDRTTHVVAVIAAPEGKTVDDPAFQSSRKTTPTRSTGGLAGCAPPPPPTPRSSAW